MGEFRLATVVLRGTFDINLQDCKNEDVSEKGEDKQGAGGTGRRETKKEEKGKEGERKES